ncbi:phosphodiester glycosidase family protein [Candidatus Roizmanbacteria bacterium]|nr:phosphodiester glycosidase family protein [Candidatus Roizmanbacteria bacterium]
MKYLIVFLVILAVAIVVWNTREDDDSILTTGTSRTPASISMTPAKNKIEIPYKQSTYILYYSFLSNRGLQIIPNFSDKLSAQTQSEKNNCRIASNGGFYTTSDTPLGLLKINYTLISGEITESHLINGFFYLDESGDPHIDRHYPVTAPTVMQSGPYFSSGSAISTVNDKPARRTVLLETTSGEYIVAAVTAKEATTSGPLLSDLPVILFSITTPFQVEKALNLDGGSASFYRDADGFTLSEFTHVGSLICATELIR